ncbi:MYG1 family protein [Senegalia massiliensis]|uniref:MYG1 family protein n=1 Tax=Senegalia massiliensis TaxID=1720316 RepID=A0A845QXJ1_9CLOT|nr:MYG1 family protein [Senegalia massiliensis]NBI06499.1 MYG1 family protein [Senegalia massiliensis]
MANQKEFKKVGTHNGRFHADDVMATAILKQIFDIELIRTRDNDILKDLDIVYDVGRGEFDHHGIEKKYRENGIPYAACGLIWRQFGKEIIKFKEDSLSEEEVNDIFHYIDRVVIEGIDALDNGIRIQQDIPLMHISKIISGFNPPWYLDDSIDNAFMEAVKLAKVVFENTFNSRISVIKSTENIITAFENRTNPKILILQQFSPWGEILKKIDERGEVLFVIYPKDHNYAIQTVRGKDGTDKKKLPKSWAGKENDELAEITGVEDAVFCHSGRFIAVAKSKEGILKMADLAINAPEEKRSKSIFDFIRDIFKK